MVIECVVNTAYDRHPYLHSFPTRRSSDLITFVFETAILGVVRVVATNEPVVEAIVEFGITFDVKLDIKEPV